MLPVDSDESQYPGSCPLEQEGLYKEKGYTEGADAGGVEQLPRASPGLDRKVLLPG